MKHKNYIERHPEMSLGDIARKRGISPQYVSQVRNGAKRQAPNKAKGDRFTSEENNFARAAVAIGTVRAAQLLAQLTEIMSA